MKALSIRQPWAWLIVHGGKDIENRTWKTSFRGEFFVHAAKKFDKTAYEILTTSGVDLPAPHEFDFGGIIGKAEITNCVSKSDSPWFLGPNGFKIFNPVPLPFKPCVGRLSFFTP